LSDLFVDWSAATELRDSQVCKLLGAVPGRSEREALVHFLAGRDERPCQGTFASLAAIGARPKG